MRLARRSGSRLWWGWVGLAALLVAHAAMAAVDPPRGAGRSAWAGPARGERVYRVRIDGDLEVMRAADDLRERFAQAARERCSVVVVEIVGTRWRPAVVVELMNAFRGSEVRTVALLEDSDDHRVGVGQLLVAAAADRCLMDAGVTARPGSLIEDAGESKVQTERTARSLREAVVQSLTRRGLTEDEAADLVGALLPPYLPGPVSLVRFEKTADRPGGIAVEAWCTVYGGAAERWTLTMADEGVTINASAAHAMHLADEFSVEGRAVVLDQGAAGSARRVERIDATVRGAAAEIEQRVPMVDEGLDAAKAELDLPDPSKHAVSKDVYRAAARRAGERLRDCETQIAAMEGLLRACPEVLRVAPPGQADIGGPGSSYAAKWRSIIQSRKDKLAKLRAKAEAFAAQ